MLRFVVGTSDRHKPRQANKLPAIIKKNTDEVIIHRDAFEGLTNDKNSLQKIKVDNLIARTNNQYPVNITNSFFEASIRMNICWNFLKCKRFLFFISSKWWEAEGKALLLFAPHNLFFLNRAI